MHRTVSEQVDWEIRAAGGGSWPQSASQYIRAAARFGFDVFFYPEPFDAEQSVTIGTTIHVPQIRRGERLLPCHRHELAEAAMQWEGRAPESAAETGRHEVARAIDLLEPPRYLTEGLQRRIGKVSAKLADLIDMAGYQRVTVTHLGPGRWSQVLEYVETET
jgi:hypothetical protein